MASQPDLSEKPTHLTVVPPPTAARSPLDSPLTPCNEKSNPASIDIQREDSNVSTPTSSTHRVAACSTLNPFDTDIEAMVPGKTNESGATANPPRKSMGGSPCNAADAQVWFGRDDWRRRHKERRLRSKNCACFAKCSKRTRVIIQVTIVLVTVGAAVAIGLAISKAVGAPIWKPRQV